MSTAINGWAPVREHRAVRGEVGAARRRGRRHDAPPLARRAGQHLELGQRLLDAAVLRRAVAQALEALDSLRARSRFAIEYSCRRKVAASGCGLGLGLALWVGALGWGQGGGQRYG